MLILESLGFLSIVCQVTSSISSFRNCLKFFSEFLQIFVSPNNVISLEMFNVCPPKKLIYLIFVYVGVSPSECVALRLPKIHN